MRNSSLPGIFSSTIPFVLGRKKMTGGFGATPMLPATIEDTYHALRILYLAHEQAALNWSEIDPCLDVQLRSYLATRLQNMSVSTKTVFQMLWCCRVIGLDFDQDAVAANIHARLESIVSLEASYYGSRILAEILGMQALPPPCETNLAAVLNQGWRAVDEAWMHMVISRNFGFSLPKQATELITWFRACQNGDGGFGFFPGTTSYTENCYVCLRALASLNAAPRGPDMAFRFLAGAQNASGGFGRKSKAVAFLYSTRDALAALAILDRLDS